jgi:uncharacterized protein YdcH (DUF465 family)
MEKISRRLDPQMQLERLEKRHGELKEQIAVLGRQRYLTVAEQLSLHEMKKEKLATKDLLAEVRRRSEPPPPPAAISVLEDN